MNREEYFLLLLEEAHNARLYASLQMQDQELTAVIKKDKYHLAAQARRKRVRADLQALGGIIVVQTNLINSQMEKTYGIKFQSFEANDYKEILDSAKGQQIQEHKNDGPGPEVRQPEGSESRPASGEIEEGDNTGNAGTGSPLSVSAGGGD